MIRALQAATDAHAVTELFHRAADYVILDSTPARCQTPPRRMISLPARPRHRSQGLASP